MRIQSFDKTVGQGARKWQNGQNRIEIGCEHYPKRTETLKNLTPSGSAGRPSGPKRSQIQSNRRRRRRLYSVAPRRCLKLGGSLFFPLPKRIRHSPAESDRIGGSSGRIAPAESRTVRVGAITANTCRAEPKGRGQQLRGLFVESCYRRFLIHALIESQIGKFKSADQ